MNSNSQKYRDFFLGVLSQSEAEAIELQIISDENFEEKLAEAENNLVEDYLDGALNHDEIRLFKENYALTPEREKNIETVRMLREYASSHHKEAPSNEYGNTFSILSWLKNLSITHPVPVISFGVALLTVSIIAYLWSRAENPFADYQAEYAELNRGDFSDLKNFENLTSISPFSEISRSDGQVVNASNIPHNESIFFRLALPPEFKNYKLFRVQLIRNKIFILSFDIENSYPRPNMPEASELRLLIPAEILEKGRYLIETVPANSAESPTIYNFVIE